MNIDQEENIAVINNIKKEKPAEFVCILPSFESDKTLGGKQIKIKEEKNDQNESYNENMKNEYEKPKYQCEICKKVFDYVTNFKAHVKIHRKNISNAKFASNLSGNPLRNT